WGENMPDHIQRIGIETVIAKDLENVTWYGRGPQDTYIDSKNHAYVGLYSATADDLYVPYVMPQEYGAKSDTDYAQITDCYGKGIIVHAPEKMMFSLRKYTTDNIDKAQHPYDLKEFDGLVLNCDMAQQGLGSAYIGPFAKEEYTLKSKEYEFRLIFTPK
ncbi:MAG: beta-galactosidase subunit alpha, partial [Armatimonadetes bacterium]|nr:beta-galactosidase subunit alpha [Candidatus Hippobium faecium]